MIIPLTPVRFLSYAEQQYPNKTAVVCGRDRFTYSQFAERVSRLAGALLKAAGAKNIRTYAHPSFHAVSGCVFPFIAAGKQAG